MIRNTSLQAYYDIQGGGTAVSQRLEILNFLRRYPDGLTRQEISSLMCIQINAACGRIKELLDDGLVFESGKRKNEHSGKLNMIVKASKITYTEARSDEI